MSFFIRMGQSRPGAERLLEAQLLPILAQCDYLDTRPEADQSFLGMEFVMSVLSHLHCFFIDQDSLLPSAIQRYHQLLMPALQVVDVMLATLGSKHTTATHEVSQIFSSHPQTHISLGFKLFVKSWFNNCHTSQKRSRIRRPADT